MKKLSELFDVRYGHSFELNHMKLADSLNGIAFVSRKNCDNGVATFVGPVKGVAPASPGELSVALGGEGGAMSTFLQERPFYTGRDVAILRNRKPLSKAALLYYCACLTANHYRYGFGRQANRTLKDILLPEPEEIPSWVEETAAIDFAGVDAPAEQAPALPLTPEAWKPFRLSSLFEIKKGKRLTKADMKPGVTPFIAAIEGNNGWRQLVSAAAIHAGNTITVNYNGSVGEAFYQPAPYYCSDDVNSLYPKFEMTPAIGLFIAAVIRMEQYRFNFGRKWHLDRMALSEIRLPVRPNGEPDWEFMERYIKTLPFSSQL